MDFYKINNDRIHSFMFLFNLCFYSELNLSTSLCRYLNCKDNNPYCAKMTSFLLMSTNVFIKFKHNYNFSYSQNVTQIFCWLIHVCLTQARESYLG